MRVKFLLSLFISLLLFAGCDNSGESSDETGSTSKNEPTSLLSEKSVFSGTGLIENDKFGWSTDISGDNAIVGMLERDGTDPSKPVSQGCVYFFKKNSNGRWSQTQMMKGSNSEIGDFFGYSVSMSGNYAVVGAYKEDGPDDNTRWQSGAVYIYKLNETSGLWEETQIIRASDARESREQDAHGGGWFGWDVDMEDGKLIVGTKCKWSPQRFTGGAYIYELNEASGLWEETAILEASDKNTDDFFGESVAIKGNRAIVGACCVNHFARNTGAAYIFEKDAASGKWKEAKVFHASDYHSLDYAGISVDIAGDFAIVGAHREDGGPMYLAEDAGAVYVLKRDAEGNWNENQILYTSVLADYDNFGLSIALEGDYAVIGCHGKEGISDSSVKNAGAVYVFQKDETGKYSEKYILQASDIKNSNKLGRPVAISNGIILASSPYKTVNGVSGYGAVYSFDINDAD